MRILSSIAIILGLVLLISTCSEPNTNLTPTLPDVVTYTNHIEEIFNRSCVRCHGGTVTYGINLSSYPLILESVGTDPSADLIVIGSSQSKLLRNKLDPVFGGMYLYLNDPFEYDLIYKWIVDDGLKQ